MFYKGNDMAILIDWDEVWKKFDEWYEKNKTKRCSKCGNIEEVLTWEEQKFKLEAIITDMIKEEE